MKRNTTAQFGSFLNSESFLDRFKTQQTDPFVRSQTQNHQNESQMNISQLQIPAKEERSINIREIIKDQANENLQTIYRCPICDRLRTICPYKSYQTNRYDQKCSIHENGRINKRMRVNSNATPSFSKELNSTLAQTRGKFFNNDIQNLNLDFGKRNMIEVDKVRFIQSNNIYPLGYARNKTNNISHYQRCYSKQNNSSQYDTKKVEKHQSTTQRAISHLPLTQQKIITAPINIQEIIFYPVIHNKLVYKSAQKTQNAEEGKNAYIKHYRYQSNRSEKKSRRVDKVVSDFLQSTQPDEILTPSQFKKLADSFIRETNPNISQE